MKTMHWLGLGLLAAAATYSRASVPAPDAVITARTKVLLLTAAGIIPDGVHVDTDAGVVTLYGSVRTSMQRDRAVFLTRTIPGVHGVRNLLQIIPAESKTVVDLVDTRIRAQAEHVLEAESARTGSRITIKAVHKGAVLLSGRANTLADQLHALESVWSIPGVRSVASEIKLPPPTKLPSEARELPWERSRDNWISANIKMKLLADAEVPALDVDVDTVGGVATLFGMVATEAARSAAVADAQQVEATLVVRDELIVVPTAEQPEVRGADAQIEDRIKAALRLRPPLRAVDVGVRNGIAHLTGTVDTGSDHLAAATVTRSTPGIRRIIDDLQLPSVRSGW
jgi:hyperosmotically inducible protein